MLRNIVEISMKEVINLYEICLIMMYLENNEDSKYAIAKSSRKNAAKLADISKYTNCTLKRKACMHFAH